MLTWIEIEVKIKNGKKKRIFQLNLYYALFPLKYVN